MLGSIAELKYAEKGTTKWCEATGMRENYSKCEGLGMGRYRNIERHRLTRGGTLGLKVVPEGEWAVSLGVPVGNDLDNSSSARPNSSPARPNSSSVEARRDASTFSTRCMTSASVSPCCWILRGFGKRCFAMEFLMRCVARQPGATTTLKPTSTFKRAVYHA